MTGPGRGRLATPVVPSSRSPEAGSQAHSTLERNLKVDIRQDRAAEPTRARLFGALI
jgi:hypothetical protein